ncbi:hypothetical protein H4N55_11825 [Aeromonas veronii]|uniref:hypothetical protein n=1 Tax=Aeromonas TaxID=642 RepID=UPI00188A9059|nr:hypothetical protein [Aeromonas veronii]MBF3237285.1 hypothetical protein [Aeromonas veronii]
MPKTPRLASLGDGAEANQRPHYSADYRSGIVPSQPFLNGKTAHNFLATPINLNQIKGHGNPASCHTLLLSQLKKSVITDTYVIF